MLKIETYIRAKQPDVLNKLHKPKNKKPKHKHRRGKKEHLSFNYIESELMTHDSYTRHNGAIKQTRWGK